MEFGTAQLCASFSSAKLRADKLLLQKISYARIERNLNELNFRESAFAEDRRHHSNSIRVSPAGPAKEVGTHKHLPGLAPGGGLTESALQVRTGDQDRIQVAAEAAGKNRMKPDSIWVFFPAEVSGAEVMWPTDKVSNISRAFVCRL